METKVAKQALPAPLLHQHIWDRYERDRPAAGNEYTNWIEAVAEELGASDYQVRKVVARQTHAFNAALQRSTQTRAQEVAELMGAGLVQALDTLGQAVLASTRKPLLDKSGRPIVDEKTGEIQWWEAPDWQVRVSAARALIEVHGANAPKQVNVDVDQQVHHFHHLSEAELMERAVQFVADIERYKNVAAGHRGGSERNVNPGSEPGLLLLDDGGNQDQGRAATKGGRPIPPVS